VTIADGYIPRGRQPRLKSPLEERMAGLKSAFQPSSALRQWVLDWAENHYGAIESHARRYRESGLGRSLAVEDLERVALAYMEVASAHTRDEGDLKLVAHRVMGQMGQVMGNGSRYGYGHFSVSQGFAMGLAEFADALAKPGNSLLEDLRASPDAKLSPKGGDAWSAMRVAWEGHAGSDPYRL
jgi:hypothetical protein